MADMYPFGTDIQRITVHSVTDAGEVHPVALLHFEDGGHLSYWLQPDNEGGIHFAAGGEELTRTLTAQGAKGRILNKLRRVI